MTRTRSPLRALAGALAVLLALSTAQEARAQVSDGLPRANPNRWTTDRLTPNEPPYINGAIAQIRGKGEGRFAILCRRGQRKAMMAYLPPAADRQQLLEATDELQVTFTFDGGATVRRKLMPTDPPFWTADFGPKSRIARLMKQALRVNLNVREFPGIDSDYTLNKSWASIEAMFATCQR